jgi:tetratricopeptide (TPR) repeat protein
MLSLTRYRQPRPLIVVATGLLLVAATSAATWLTRPPSVAPQAIPAAARAEELVPAAPPAGATDPILERYARAIRAWTTSLEDSSANSLAATNLGIVYAGRARLTGDLTDYDRALQAADHALGLDPAYLPALELRATILFALHDFSAARAEAQRVVDREPTALQALAVVGDASLELGDLAAARAAYHLLAEQSPTAPVWSRLAHLAFVEGDLDGALAHVGNAIAATPSLPGSEEAAFYAFQHGELLRSAGRVVEAEAAYESALEALPDHIPATAGLARIREAQGRRTEAIALLEEVTARQPQPELVAMLGDLYALAGDTNAAEGQYALVERIGEVGTASGSVYDRQLVLFAADHDRGVDAAIAAAEASLTDRTDIYAYDALAWALYQAGRLDEAAAAADAALVLDTPDPRIAYHAGMIAAARGELEEARRLLERAVAGAAYLPPLQVPIAIEALAELGGER